MKPQPSAITISLLDREYQIACPAEEEQQLHLAAQYLSKKMREIRDKGNVIGSDRIAVMAALNIAHDYLQLKALESEYESISQRIGALKQSIGATLEKEATKPQQKLI